MKLPVLPAKDVLSLTWPARKINAMENIVGCIPDVWRSKQVEVSRAILLQQNI